MKLKNLFLLALGMTACNSQPASNSTIANLPHPGSTSQTGIPTVSGTPKITATPPTGTPVAITSRGVGLVWNGNGACDDDCALAGANAVTAAGLTARYVNENLPLKTSADLDAIFADAKVWVMPGGYASNEVEAMPALLRTALLNFISNGGGYVGWCAGAFAATSEIGTIGVAGLGIFPGHTVVYNTTSKQNTYGGSIEKLSWVNDTHYFYLEGGPYLTDLPSNVEVIGRYDDQVSVAAARTTYGKGRVYLSGVHPEAPKWWWTGTSISDPDGTDEAYAQDMIKWAAGLE